MNTYLSNRRGAVIVIAALILPVFLALAGLAVDTANAYMQKNKMQNALDAAAMSAAYLLSSTNPDTETKTAIEKRLNKHFQGSLNGLTSEVSIENYTPTDDNNPAMLLKATSEYKPVFLSIVGIKNFPINVTTRVRGKVNGNIGKPDISNLGSADAAIFTELSKYGLVSLSQDKPFILFETAGGNKYDTSFVSYSHFEFSKDLYKLSLSNPEATPNINYSYLVDGGNITKGKTSFITTGSQLPFGMYYNEWSNNLKIEPFITLNATGLPSVNGAKTALENFIKASIKVAEESGKVSGVIDGAEGNSIFKTAKTTPYIHSKTSIKVTQVDYDTDIEVGAVITANDDIYIGGHTGIYRKEDETKALIICSLNGNISFPANGGTFKNLILIAPNGNVELRGGGAKYTGNIFADTIQIGGGSNEFYGSASGANTGSVKPSIIE